MAFIEPPPGPALKYCESLRAEVFTAVTTGGPKAFVHRSEWAKVMAGARCHVSSARLRGKRARRRTPGGGASRQAKCETGRAAEAAGGARAGEPVEINPSIGNGFKVMTVQEYVSKWKRCVGAARRSRDA